MRSGRWALLRRARLGLVARAAIAQRRRDQRARGRAAQDALAAQDRAGGGVGLGIRNGVGVGDAREIAHRRDEVFADALDGPASHRLDLAGLDVMNEDRALGVGEDDPRLRRDAREIVGEARDRAAGADAADHRVDVVVHLGEDLGARRRLVGARIGRIAELVGVPGAGDLAGEAAGYVLVVVGVALADVRTRHAHLGPERADVLDLLLAHLVGDDEEQAIALLPGD